MQLHKVPHSFAQLRAWVPTPVRSSTELHTAPLSSIHPHTVPYSLIQLLHSGPLSCTSVHATAHRSTQLLFAHIHLYSTNVSEILFSIIVISRNFVSLVVQILILFHQIFYFRDFKNRYEHLCPRRNLRNELDGVFRKLCN